MARDAEIEARLQRWAAWVTVGDGSGYPVMSVLHPHWQPPSPGITPTMKVSAHSDVRETHRAIGTLSRKPREAVVLYYCKRPSLAQMALELGCAQSTVINRLEQAHQSLRAELCKKLLSV